MNRDTFFLSILGMAMGLLLATGCTPSGPKALLQGERLIQEGRYELAIQKLKWATTQLPRNSQAWNHLGLAYHGAKQMDLAAQAYLQALALDRNLAPAYFNLGCLLLDQQKPDAALVPLTRFVQMQPASPDGWLKLGRAQSESRQWPAAELSYRKSIQLQPASPAAWNDWGLLELRQNRASEAMGCFANALKLQGNYGPALLNQAIAYQEHFKNRALALQKYREYLALEPPPPNADSVRQIVEELELEMKPVQPRRASSPPPQQLASANHQAPAASSNSAHPNPPQTAVVPKPQPANNHSTSAPRPEAAVRIAKAEPPSIPAPAITHPAQATVPKTPADANGSAHSEPKTESAPPAAKPPAPTTEPPPPRDITTHSTQPVSMPTTDVGNEPPPVAPQPVSTPVSTPPQPEIRETQPSVLAQSSSPIPAETTQPMPQTAAPSKKPGLLARLNPASWMGSQSKSEPPITPLSPLATLQPKATTPPAVPQPAPVKAVSAPPEPPPPARYPYVNPPRPPAGDIRAAEQLFTRGVECQRAGLWNEAVAAYRKAVETSPSYFDARYNLGLADYNSGLLSQALLEFETALAIQPGSFNARYNFALALQRANYPQDAANELEKLAKAAPNDTRVQLLLGNLYAQKLYQSELAREHYLKLLELDPGNSQAAAIRYWLANHP